MPTIAQAITEGADRFHASGVDQARRTAGLLLCHVVGIDRTHLLTRSEEQIDEASYRTYLALVERRAAGEPLQYISGHQEFYGLDFIVTPDVLIPRPETEFLAERVIKLVSESRKRTPLIVDLGTGSGCIAVALAVHLPGARVIATDSSHVALDVARANAERHRVGDRIEFLEGDLVAPLLERHLDGAVDVLASNPPYVHEESPELIQREVSEWEPHTALFGGADGLDFYRRLLADAPRFLKPNGYLVFEIGHAQLDPIRELIDRSALELVDVTHDLQGLPRTLTLRLTPILPPASRIAD
ncbi:MAG: peptide chain release factor N(5)-glutamine methyltransferase [Acidobacteriota bacterium]